MVFVTHPSTIRDICLMTMTKIDSLIRAEHFSKLIVHISVAINCVNTNTYSLVFHRTHRERPKNERERKEAIMFTERCSKCNIAEMISTKITKLMFAE